MKSKHSIRIGTVLFLIVVTAIISVTGTYFYVSSLVNELATSQQMYLELSNVEQLVVQHYVRSISNLSDYDAMQDGIISGYVNGLGDPYSYYLTEKNYKSSAIQTSTAFSCGVHAGFDRDTESIEVLFVKPGSPAEKAGVLQGDIILSVDGVSVTEMGYKAAVRKLSAEEDETLTLTVLREGSSDLLLLAVKFERYDSQSVTASVLDNGYGYLVIREFDGAAPGQVADAVTFFKKEKVPGVIVDVRDNADGDYDSMFAAVDKLLPSCTVCTRKQARAADTRLFTSDAEGLTVPFVVMQNGKTSGAAEIFCAACSENEIAYTLGETTAGVGLAQSEFALSNGTALVLSVYEYLTPMGNTVEGNGVLPSFTIGFSETLLNEAASRLTAVIAGE